MCAASSIATTLAEPLTESVRMATVSVYVLPGDTEIEVCWLYPLKAAAPPNSCRYAAPLLAGAMRSGTRPGLPDSMAGADHDCGTVADMDGCENFIWRRIDGLELIAAIPIEPLAKLASVAVVVAVPPEPLILQVIWEPVAVAVNV